LSLQNVFASVWHLTPFAICSYFDPPTQGSGLWQSLRSYAELLSGLLLLRFLIWNTLKYLVPGAFVDKVLRYWFAVTSQAVGLSEFFIAQADGSGESKIGNSVDQNPYEAKR
jgi:E3 ubiquitin-protein ligase MARCH6